jgi:hypothetical protein
MRKNHHYKVNKLVIGTDLSALIYAYLNNYTFIFKEVIEPTPFEFLPLEFPFHLFNHDKVEIEMVSLDGAVKFGTPKIELWNRLVFVMSASGLLPFGLKDITIREEDDALAVKTKSRNYYYAVGEVIKIKNTFHKYKVFDWISVRSCGANHLQYVDTDDAFVAELFFYPSQRTGAKQNDNDILVISNLTESQVCDFEFGETMTRIRTKVLLHEMGIRGPRNGKNPTYPRSPERYKYAPIKLEHSHREVRRNKTNNSELDIVQSYFNEDKSLPEDTYLYKFNRRVSQRSLLRT